MSVTGNIIITCTVFAHLSCPLFCLCGYFQDVIRHNNKPAEEEQQKGILMMWFLRLIVLHLAIKCHMEGVTALESEWPSRNQKVYGSSRGRV